MQAKDRKSEMEDIVVGGFRAERTGLRQITGWLQTSPGPFVDQYRGVFEVGGVEAFGEPPNIDLNSNSDDRAEPLNGEDRGLCRSNGWAADSYQVSANCASKAKYSAGSS
jgi:hypothetical protein